MCKININWMVFIAATVPLRSDQCWLWAGHNLAAIPRPKTWQNGIILFAMTSYDAHSQSARLLSIGCAEIWWQ